MNFGLDSKQFELLKDMVLLPLIKKGAKVYVFGSRARGQHHPFSDIDLLYEEDPSMKIASGDISRIKENLENSNLVIKVDLVNTLNLAPSYKEKIDREKIMITFA